VNPINKVYALNKPLHQMSLLFSILTLFSFDHTYFSDHLSSIRGKEHENALRLENNTILMDGPALIMGIITVFKQFHP
jgi:hypothetical protein